MAKQSSKGAAAQARMLNLACDIERQGERLHPKILAGKDGELHASAIVLSVLECLRGHAFEAPITGAELQVAINAYCQGAHVKQVRDGITFRLVREPVAS